MTVPPVYEAPPGVPPAAPKPANRRGLMIGIGVVVVLCLCICIVGAVMFGGPFMAAANLPQECAERNPAMDAQACGEWVQGVGSPMISECISEQMSEAGTVSSDSLYDCLVGKGVGP